MALHASPAAAAVDCPVPNPAGLHVREDPAASSMFNLHLPVISLAQDGPDALREHLQRHSPAVITDFAAASPGLQGWTPENLAARFGHKTVRVYDASFGAPGKHYMGSIATMPFRDFLAEVMGGGRDLRMFLYNVGRQIPELLDDLVFPDVGLRLSRRFVYTFFGCKGSTTPLHYDIDMGHVLHTAIHGRRRVRLFAPDQSATLYQHPFTVRSYVDLDQPDLQAHPAIAGARGYATVLQPGQTLFMPSGYWHEFHYLDAGIGLSLRSGSTRLADRLAGAINLLALSPVDRLANKVAPRAWFDWKQRRAHARANACLSRKDLS